MHSVYCVEAVFYWVFQHVATLVSLCISVKQDLDRLVHVPNMDKRNMRLHVVVATDVAC